MFFYRLLRIGLHILRYVLLITYEVRGLEHLPKKGSYLIVLNHLSLLDTPLVFLGIPSTNWLMLVGERYETIPVIGYLLRRSGAVFVDRTQFDRRSLQKVLKALDERSDTTFAVAPEGTRSETGQLAEGKNGTAYLALKADLPIVPLGMLNTDTWRKNLFRFRPSHLVMQIGPSFRLAPPEGRVNRHALDHCTEEIMLRMAALLPEARRGVYAAHPDLVAGRFDSTD